MADDNSSLLKPHFVNSFDYKITDKRITDILRARSMMDNTTQIAMPFVKATTTIQIPEYLGDGNIGFTLGLHAIEQDVKYQDIFSNNNAAVGAGTVPLVGYTYTSEGKNQLIYATPPASLASKLNQFFDQGKDLYNSPDSEEFVRIPPPGITKATIGRNKNGLLAAGQITISVPTLSQLEILHRTFLIPGVGMILEWGQQFAPEKNPSLGEISALNGEKMFPWYDNAKLKDILTRIARRQVGMQEILNEYVYPNQGQYMWMFGRVANFSTKANADGSFECDIKIVGPSEDSWAYSTQQTAIPPRDGSGQICLDKVNSIESYFTKTNPGLNFKSVLDGVFSGGLLPEWKGHVIKIPQGNKKDGEPAKNDPKANISQASFADSEDAYFLSWRFLINVILNDEKYGLRAIFKTALLPENEEAYKKIAFIRPYVDKRTDGITPLNSTAQYIDDPLESFVGYNQHLRSVDPGTLIVVNEQAVENAKRRTTANRPDPEASEVITDASDFEKQFINKGKFELSADLVDKGKTAKDRDRGFLSTGVWINHKAVVESMVGAETVLRGVMNLLQRMNNATRGYWNLTLDSAEPISEVQLADQSILKLNDTSYEYSVIDINYKENSDLATEKLLKNIYVFNKYVRKSNDGTLYGSEVTDCSVDMSLPKRMFSQIATMGLVQPQDLANAGVQAEKEEFADDMCSPKSPASPGVSEANEALRQMFAITTLSTKGQSTQGPDLTILPAQLPAKGSVCGQANSQTTAMTAGQGTMPSDLNVDAAKKKNDEELKKSKEEAEKFLADNKCAEKCPQPTPVPTPTTATTNPYAAVNVESVPYDSISGRKNIPIRTDAPSSKKLAGPAQLVAAGYSNGKIPTSKMVRITQNATCGGGAYTFKEPGEKIIQMINAAKADGFDITYCEGYRPISVQINCVKEKGCTLDDPHVNFPNGVYSKTQRKKVGLCAQPGTSNHGWGLAFDLASKGVQINSKTASTIGVFNWLTANASRFGFIKDANEDWHWEYKDPITVPPASPSTTPPVPIPTPTATPPLSKECVECAKRQDLLNAIGAEEKSRESAQKSKDAILTRQREFHNLEKLFRYIEPMPDLMLAYIRCTSDGKRSNAFGAAPGTLSMTADLTLPGINGMRIGELFWIDRVPAFYKAFGAFQIQSIEDNIDTSGWQTRIHSAFNYLGDSWKESVVNILVKGGILDNGGD